MPPRVPVVTSKRPVRARPAIQLTNRPSARAQIEAAKARLRAGPDTGAFGPTASQYDEIRARGDQAAAARRDLNEEILRTLTALDARMGRIERKLDAIVQDVELAETTEAADASDNAKATEPEAAPAPEQAPAEPPAPAAKTDAP